MKKIIGFGLLFLFIMNVSQSVLAAETKAYELIYDEQETGTGVYKVRFIVSDKYIRIEDVDDEESSGYIIYDHNKRTIYSVSHFDKSILKIPYYEFKKPDMEGKVKVNYNAMTDAPKIAGNTVYTYTAHAGSEKCMDIQLVSELLPSVEKMLKSYQSVVAGQQVKVLKTTPVEYQTACFLYDQVYNDGKYYERGLPIREWHSNGKQRVLASYKKVTVDSGMYELPSDYREYSLD